MKETNKSNTIKLTLGLLILVFFSFNSYVISIGLSIIILGVAFTVQYISNNWVTAKANEWLLVISNGQQIRAGVGLKHFKKPNETVVTMPATIRGVQFTANQVTNENFGIEIEGIIFWSIHREGDSPFKHYKYQGDEINNSIRKVCESIVRNQISNTTLMNVLKKRVEFRESVRKSLIKQLEGWGVWPETVEITEVKISSNQLFKDLQTEFRMKHRQLASDAKLNSEAILNDEKQQFEAIENKTQQELETELTKYKQDLDLQLDEFKQQLEERKVQLTKQQILQDTQIEKLNNENSTQQNHLRIQQDNEKQSTNIQYEKEKEKLWQEAKDTMNARNLELLQLEKNTDYYIERQHTCTVSANQYSGPEEIGQLASVLPGLNILNQAIQK